MPRTQFFQRPGKPSLACCQYKPEKPGKATVVFCSGYRSDMQGSKAVYLEAYARAAGFGFLRFDYRGHGESEGAFNSSVLSDWIEDAQDIIEALTHGPLILIGSSMGGWITLRLSQLLKERVKGMVLIAPAPDFTRDLFWASFDEETKAKIENDGYVELPNAYSDEPYFVSKALIEDGDKHAMMAAPIEFDGPVRILQGQLDDSVPWQRAAELTDKLTSDQVELSLFKDGDHRLSEPHHLAKLGRAVTDMMKSI